MSEPAATAPITAAWLGEVLREGGLGAQVEAIECQLVGVFSSEIWRLRVHYAGDGGGAPRSLIVKRPAPGRRERSGESFDAELRFYNELAASLPVRVPRRYYGGPGPSGEGSLLLLEDVEHLQPFHFVQGASPLHARRGMEALAALHAHGWQRFAGTPWIQDLGDPAVRAGWGRDFDRGWQTQRERLLAYADPAFGAIGDALTGRLPGTLAALTSPATLLHGDAHAENLPLAGERGRERAVLLDWAGPRRGHAGFDVAVFVVMSLPVEDRRREERGLVEHHAAAVAAAGVPGFTDPWPAFRLGVLRRAARVVEFAEHWPRGRAAEGALRMVAERCLTAAVDHRVGELIAA